MQAGSGAPPVSVIVTTFNRHKLLSETLASILNQSFTDFELIVVDNMSKDKTEEYVRGLNDPRVVFFKNPNSGVIAVNRNFGIKKARGKYVAFCDDDDLWFDYKLKTQVDFMEANPDVGLTFSNAETFGDGATGRPLYVKGASESVKDVDSLLRGNKIATFTAMVRKACLDDVGGFDERPDFISIEDYDLWLRIALKYRLACMPVMLGRYRVHSQRTSGDNLFEKKKLLRLVEKFKKSGLLGASRTRRLESHVHWMIGNAALLVKDAAFRTHYRMALSLSLNAMTLLGLLLAFSPMNVAVNALKFLGRVRS